MQGPMISVVSKEFGSIYPVYALRILRYKDKFSVYAYTSARLSDYDQVCISAGHDTLDLAKKVVKAVAESIELGKRIHYIDSNSLREVD